MNDSSQIFFTRSFTHRKPVALLMGSLFLAFGGFTLGKLALEISHAKWSVGAMVSGLFVGGIGGVLALAGLVVLRRWVARTTLLLEISTAGVRYGDVVHSWNAIHWLSGRTERDGIQLFYQTRDSGLAGCDRPMPVDPNLTLEEFENLMDKLDSAISEKHPNVTFGHEA